MHTYWKLNFRSYQFVLDAFPIRPKKPFDQRNVATYVKDILGYFGWGGGKGARLNKLKMISIIGNNSLYH